MAAQDIKISRYPSTSDRSLKAWSAADEYILQEVNRINGDGKSIAIYNDRFGYLSTHLAHFSPIIISNYKTQEESIRYNFEDNKIAKEPNFHSPLADLKAKIDLALIRIPKSIDLFRLFLVHICKHSNENTQVICGFMTKYFTKQMILVAEEYFEEVSQSLAQKKSRLITLSKPKQDWNSNIINEIRHSSFDDQEHTLKQYYGVFSAKHIDYATQFLLENLELDGLIRNVLDLASGNGVIAFEVLQMKPNCDVSLVDDSILAIESSKLNVTSENAYFYHDHHLDRFDNESFDLIICNPPFHFEHENNIDIALNLFKDAKRVLDEEGRFVCVANIHLNYRIHLKRLFHQVDALAMNDKFIVYECWK